MPGSFEDVAGRVHVEWCLASWPSRPFWRPAGGSSLCLYRPAWLAHLGSLSGQRDADDGQEREWWRPWEYCWWQERWIKLLSLYMWVVSWPRRCCSQGQSWVESLTRLKKETLRLSYVDLYVDMDVLVHHTTCSMWNFHRLGLVLVEIGAFEDLV